MAAENGHEVAVRLLIERGDVDVNVMNGYGETPFFVAAENGHEAVVRQLIERDDDEPTPLCVAAKAVVQ